MGESYPRDGQEAAAVENERTPAGEVSRQLRHAFNNPLTALLAEAQLLEMSDDLSPDVHATAERILALVRRLVSLTRALEADDESPRVG